MPIFEHRGNTYMESDLLPIGERVPLKEIECGRLQEIELTYNGQTRHLPLITARGYQQIYSREELNGDGRNV